MFPKKINVVGNAHSLFEKNYGELIDQNPVIRFNYLESLDPRCQGTRWDWMATSNPREIKKWNNKPITFDKFLFTVWAEKEKRYLDYRTWKDIPVYTIPDEIWQECQEKTKKRPSSGILVIYTLHKLGIEDVNIFGFDWKETKTYYNDSKTDLSESNFHDYDDEKNICLRLIEKNNWKLYL